MAGTQQEKIVGIIGGMGPEATVDLMQRIIRLTPAHDDIDHIRLIVDCNPKIPSRIRAIIDGDGESPLPCLVQMARGLESFGADLLAIPCNTAHHYHADIQAAVQIPVLNMVELTVAAVTHAQQGAKAIGIVASDAIQITGIYADCLQRFGLRPLYPQADAQKRLMDIIRSVKAGRSASELSPAYHEIVTGLGALGAQAAVIACTELSTLPLSVPNIHVVDAAEVLATAIVSAVKGGR